MKNNTKLPLNNYLNNIKFHNINTINNKTISKLNISNLNNHSKNIPKLLHSPFYKEINVTKGDYEEFLASLPDDIK